MTTLDFIMWQRRA